MPVCGVRFRGGIPVCGDSGSNGNAPGGGVVTPADAIFDWQLSYPYPNIAALDFVESMPIIRRGDPKNVYQTINKIVKSYSSNILAWDVGTGLLTEGIAATNQVPYSSDISQGWTPAKSGGITSLPILTKDFTTEEGQKCARIQMDRAGATAAGDLVNVADNILASPVIGEVWIMQFRAKLNTGTSREVRPYVNSSAPAYGSNITITDEWTSFSLTFTATGTGAGWGLLLRGSLSTSDDADILIQMDDTTQASGIMVAKESDASSFIYTNGSAVTRAADVALTGTSTVSVDSVATGYGAYAGAFTAGDWLNGVDTTNSKITFFSGGKYAALIVAAVTNSIGYNPSNGAKISLAYDGSSPNNLDYTKLTNPLTGVLTTDAEVQAGFQNTGDSSNLFDIYLFPSDYASNADIADLRNDADDQGNNTETRYYEFGAAIEYIDIDEQTLVGDALDISWMANPSSLAAAQRYTSNTTNSDGVLVLATGAIRVVIGGNNYTSPPGALVVGTDGTPRAKRTGSNLVITVGSTEVFNGACVTDDFIVDRLGNSIGSTRVRGKFADINLNGEHLYYIRPDKANFSTTVTDEIGDSDGTFVNASAAYAMGGWVDHPTTDLVIADSFIYKGSDNDFPRIWESALDANNSISLQYDLSLNRVVVASTIAGVLTSHFLSITPPVYDDTIDVSIEVDSTLGLRINYNGVYSTYAAITEIIYGTYFRLAGRVSDDTRSMNMVHAGHLVGGIALGPWLLESGFWDDDGNWDDNSVWTD